MKTSVSIGMFWFHINWDETGKTGLDQHGYEWENKDSPQLKNKLIEETYINANIDVHSDLKKLLEKNKLTDAERDLLTQEKLS